MKTRLQFTLPAILILAWALQGQALPAQASNQQSPSNGPGAAPLAAIGAGEQFRIRFTRLHCNDAQEEDFWSDGDEPYVILGAITPTGVGGLPALSVQRTSIYDDMDDGNNRNPNLDLFNGHLESSVAVAAQVVEHDSTNVNTAYGLARSFAEVDFATDVLGGTTNVTTLSSTVGDGFHRGVRAAYLPLIDDDETIGDAALLTISTATLDALAVGGSTTFDRTVSGSDARYTMTFEVTRTR